MLISVLKSNLDEKAQAYNAAVEDMNDLLAFNYNISIDPDYTKKEFIKALRDVKLHEMELRQRLEDFKFNFRAQELEYKAQVCK